MAGEKILIIDDEPEISNLISLYLNKEKFLSVIVDNGLQALEIVESERPDLIILDILLPGIDGIEICQKIRSHTSAPIIFLSCKDEDTDKVIGLGVGGDDYITKPFSPSELIARVKAHLRRSRINSSLSPLNNSQEVLLKFPGLEINFSNHTVRVKDMFVTLSAKEFQLLTVLSQNANRLFNIEQLYDLVWGEETAGDTRTIPVHISNLRKKIETDPANPRYILTVRGVGYKFNNPAKLYGG